MKASGFMHKYYDWAAFEIFVKNLYEGDGDVTIDRDVTEVDRYGAKRQIDVKISRRFRFDRLVTIVECKRWKDPVSRDRIDVLAATVEGLGANSGAIFTTTGFEEGAIAYAKGKGIELFVVRDLTDMEWGRPGRHLSLFVHTVAAEFRDIVVAAKAFPLVDDMPGSFNLKIDLKKEMAADPDLDLFSVKTGARGPNLVGVLADAHALILGALSNSIGLVEDGREITLEIDAVCDADFTLTDYCQLRLPTAVVRIEHIGFVFRAHVAQSKIEIDRAQDLDFAVMVESYVSDQRLIAHRRQGDLGVNFQTVDTANDVNTRSGDVLENGSVVKVRCSPWVGLGEAVADRRGFTNKPIGVNVEIVDGKPQLSLKTT